MADDSGNGEGGVQGVGGPPERGAERAPKEPRTSGAAGPRVDVLEGDLDGVPTWVALWPHPNGKDVLVVRKSGGSGPVVASWGGTNAPGFFARRGMTASSGAAPDVREVAERMVAQEAARRH